MKLMLSKYLIIMILYELLHSKSFFFCSFVTRCIVWLNIKPVLKKMLGYLVSFCIFFLSFSPPPLSPVLSPSLYWTICKSVAEITILSFLNTSVDIIALQYNSLCDSAKIIQRERYLTKMWRNKKLNRNLVIPFSDCHHFFSLSGSKLVIKFSMVWLLGWVCGSYGNLGSQMKHFCSPWKTHH